MLAKESREMLGIMDNLRYNGLYLSLSRLWYTAPPMKGGTTYGQSTVPRCADPPHRVPGFHECDPGGISDAGPALRGGVPGAHGRVASRWETAHRPPVYRLQELLPADTRRSAIFHSG